MRKMLSKCIPLVAVALLAVPISASATTNTDIDYNNKMTSGRDIAYYIAPGTEYTVSIPSAAQKLMYPSGMSNNIVLSRTTNSNASKMDFYQYRTADGIAAKTSSWRKNSAGAYYAMPVIEKDSYDWVYAEIHINDYYMAGYTNTNRDKVLIHEMLHGYGLKDINRPTSIMHYTVGGSATGLTSDANTVLNQKY